MVVVTGVSYGATTSSNDYLTVGYDPETGTQRWVRRFDGTGHGSDYAKALVAAPNGRTFVTGYADMGRTRDDYLTLALDTYSGILVWFRSYSRSTESLDYAQAIDLNPDASRVFVTGRSTNGARGEDFTTLAMDAATGGRVWVRRYDGPGHFTDEASDVLVSPDGSEVIVSGASDNGAGNSDYATIAYRADVGDPIWARRFDGSAHDTDFPFALASSTDGADVYVTGYVTTSVGGIDYGTLSYVMSTGAPVGARIYQGPAHPSDYGSDYGVDVATSSSQVFITGQSYSDRTGNNDYATVAYKN
jgi:hypothetical protein